MKKLYYIFIILTVTACERPSERLKKLLEPPPSTRLDKYQVFCSDTIYIDVPDNKFSNYHEFTIYKDSLLYGVNITRPLTIDIYDLIKKKYASSINVAEYELPSKKVRNMYIQSTDSIFFLESFPPAIFLIDSMGNIINRYNTKNGLIESDESINTPLIFTFATMLIYRDPIFKPSENEMVILTHPMDSEVLPGYENVNRIGVFNISENRWDRFMGKPEGVLSAKGKFCYNFDLSSPYFLEVDSILYITYPVDHFIYAYNINSGELLFKKAANSKIPKNLALPIKRSKINDTQYAWNYRIQIPFYGPLFYNKKLKMFTRNFHFRQDLKLNNGKLNDGSRRKGSVIILDSTLKIVGETFFENGELGVLKCLPMSDGFLMAPNSFKQESDDILAYKYKYEIRKIDDK